MATATTDNTAPTLETGTYEIIQNRLQEQARDLSTRLKQLNTARKEVFGAVETQLIANERINTKNYCTARDIVAIGDRCIFGYNVHIGLRSGIKLSDVFSAFQFENKNFKAVDLEWDTNEKFKTDFQNLYRYYKNAFFARFVRQGAYLYLVFQISKNATDFKAFKWIIKGDELAYIDNRSEHEIQMPEQHEFRWKRVHRDDQRKGMHPHVSIMDRVFVETVGGDLTIKVEDNTDDGLGIYREEVEYSDQTLDDAEFLYADLGNLIALKIRPYQEDYRYFVFNEKMQRVRRIDALEDSGVLLPDNHGLIFANGYYLQTGEYKIFPTDIRDLQFEKRIPSPNGEDYLFVFFNKESGTYVLLSYNVIEQKVATPIVCHGYTVFPDGELCYFRAEEEPTKHHVVQIWQTPYLSGEEVPSAHTDSYLYKVGNKDIVKAMAEVSAILSLTQKEDSYANLYDDLVKMTSDVLDAYYWIDKVQAFEMHIPVQQIRETANSAIGEYEKKISIQRATQEEIARVRTKAENLFQKAKRQNYDSVDNYVNVLAELRVLRGEIITLKDLRYTDLELIEQLEETAIQTAANLSEGCVNFLLQEDALDPYREKIAAQQADLQQVNTGKEAEAVLENVDAIGGELELLIDIVSNLKIEDATQTTRIIDNISAFYAQLNQLKANVRRRRKELTGTEAIAEFNAQLKLLDQGIINYLDVAATPTKCDEYLTKLMVQLEELESKFAEFDEFIESITEKREEIYNAFETRKKNLVESRNNRTSALQKAAERILNGIQNRVKNFKEVSEINGFFASDLMIDKVRDLITQLTDLEDTNKANAVQTQLKTLREEAVRQLRDQQDLFVDGENVIRFGKHNFSVNVQPLDLTIVQRDGDLYFHLTGTDFYEKIEDEQLLATQNVWQQSLVSENSEVYRAEYLAYLAFQADIGKNTHGEATIDVEELLSLIQQFAATRYEEGYTKGVHDADAAQILAALYSLEKGIDLLHFSADVRAAAQLFWEKLLAREQREELAQQLASAGEVLTVFPDSGGYEWLVEEIVSKLDINT